MRCDNAVVIRKYFIRFILVLGISLSLFWFYSSWEQRFQEYSSLIHTKIPDRIPLPKTDRFYGLSKGKFLVATDNVRDPRFMETVILLVKHDRSGSVGLIINRPLEVRLSEIFPGVKGLGKKSDPVYFGGPVNLERALILLRSPKDLGDSSHVFGTVYSSDSISLLQQLADTDKKGKDYRVYIGYSGWAAGQLERELSRDDWRVLKADAETIFDKPSGEIWPELIQRGFAIQAKREPETLRGKVLCLRRTVLL